MLKMQTFGSSSQYRMDFCAPLERIISTLREIEREHGYKIRINVKKCSKFEKVK